MEKRALILDGRIGEDTMAEQSLELAMAWLHDRNWNVTALRLCELDIAPCIGCFGCWIKTPGECVIDDAGREVSRNVVGSDLAVYLTPIQFGGYSYELKKALDRSICIISPFFRKVKGEVHHKKRYARYPNVAALGWSKRLADYEDDIFENLVRRNAINMHAPKTAVSVLGPEDADARGRRIEWTLGEVAR
ncbi:MAG: NAD(P)H-dependent oxidoreductase [Candidatus Bipolaricaulota bacterium]